MRTLPLLPLLTLIACDDIGEKGDDTGSFSEDSGPYCQDNPTDISLEEASALGFSGAEMLALAEGSHDEIFNWAQGDPAGLSLIVSSRAEGSARYIQSVAVYPETDGPTPAIGVVCEDRMEVDVTIQLSTDDGAFDETLEVALSATAPGAVRFSSALQPDALDGSFDLDAFAADESYDESSMSVQGSFSAEAPRGRIEAQLTGQNDTVAWATNLPVGTWGDESLER